MKVITDVHIFKSSDDIRTYKALWDTGATETLMIRLLKFLIQF